MRIAGTVGQCRSGFSTGRASCDEAVVSNTWETS